MHIEPGLLANHTIVAANGAAAALLAAHAPALLRQPGLWLRTALATAFFTLCMQAVHLKVGPSELHFIGAMPIYLTLGYLPTLFGFAAGLLLQGLLFEPQDLLHLGVNALSLIVPLMVLHATSVRRQLDQGLRGLLRLDATYYGGVTLMVGFWLAQGLVGTPLADWLRFAASYAAVVAAEPLLTIGLLGLLRRPGLPGWLRPSIDQARA
jgi:ABC-type Co2+ transport system permease subunit